MFHGGTNFGYWNGAEVNGPVITSYDYFAPISEAGDLTEKYYAIRNWIKSLPNWPHEPSEIPRPTKKRSYGRIALKNAGSLLDLLPIVSINCQDSKYPLTFEQLNHPFGFVLYQSHLPEEHKFNAVQNNTKQYKLTLSGLKDHGFVLVDGFFQGALYAAFGNRTRLSITINGNINSILSILVENRGRQTSETINDVKGLTGNVSLNGNLLTDWHQCGIDLARMFRRSNRKYFSKGKKPELRNKEFFSPSIFIGTFRATTMDDTFFDPSGWGKGQFLLNGMNIGRYWPSIGPQITLYTPKFALRKFNKVLLFELEHPANCQMNKCLFSFIDKPIMNINITGEL